MNNLIKLEHIKTDFAAADSDCTNKFLPSDVPDSSSSILQPPPPKELHKKAKAGTNSTTNDSLPDTLYACIDCNFKTNLTKHLKQHKLNVHTVYKPFKCSQCKYSTARKFLLQEHMNMHKGIKPYKCNKCHYSTSWKTNLNKHMKSHVRSKRKVVITENSESEKALHTFKCLDNKEQLVKIFKNGCKQVVHSKNQPNKHTESTCNVTRKEHGEKDQLPTFSYSKGKEQPVRIFANESTEEIVSTDKTVTTETQVVESTIRICDMMKKEQNALQYDEYGIFKCFECPYKTEHRERLKKHMRLHMGEKRFNCEKCGHKTASIKDLRRHRMTHIGKNGFSCTQCDYKTTGKRDLRKHTRIHTGERPFRCFLCGYRTTQNCNLKTHMKMHIRKQEIPLQLNCRKMFLE